VGHAYVRGKARPGRSLRTGIDTVGVSWSRCRLDRGCWVFGVLHCDWWLLAVESGIARAFGVDRKGLGCLARRSGR